MRVTNTGFLLPNSYLDDLAPDEAFQPPVDLSNCDREPIHIPGAIQEHGALLSLRDSDWTVMQASANACAFFGLTEPGSAAVGRPFNDLVGSAAAAKLVAALAVKDATGRDPCHVITSGPRGEWWDINAHRHRGALIVEFERTDPSPAQNYELLMRLQREFDEVAESSDMQSLWKRSARLVKEMTGMDRVMVYRFDAEWNGEIVAEERRPDLAPLLGLHYPATDIPTQARRLYTENLVRFIPDMAYVPVPLVPEMNPQNGRPLDLSFSMLRSVSPIHVEYLTNMGVRATLVISLMVSGKLWGLIACHHYSTLYLSYIQRRFAGLIGQTLGLVLAEAERRRHSEGLLEVQAVRGRIAQESERASTLTFAELLDLVGTELLEVLKATSLVSWSGQSWKQYGAPLPEKRIPMLIDAVRGHLATQSTWNTDRLTALHPELADLAARASGVLAVRLDAECRSGLAYLRPERIEEISWAGDPHKAVTLAEEGNRLSPRRSFATFKEVVRGRSRPWVIDLDEVLRDLETARERIDKRAALVNMIMLERAAAQASDSIIITDGRLDAPGPTIVYVNRAFTQLTGFTAEEAIGRSPRMLQSPRTSRRKLDRFRRALERGHSCRIEVVNQRADGSEFIVEMIADPVFGPDGKVTHYIAIQRDATERELVQEQLKTFNDDLMQRVQEQIANLRRSLRAMEDFDLTLASDILAPLAAISGSMAALSAPHADATSGVIKVAMERIAANVERVRHLTDELAHFARQSSGDVERLDVDMRAIATEAADHLRGDWPNTAFRIESMPPCEGDAALLRQVWRHLLGLAARFAAEGSTQRVRARFEDGSYCVEDEADNQPASAVAKLTGVARLVRDEAESAEAGVRISIAKHIVERHGGRVSAEPRGNGTTMMRFTIPRPVEIPKKA